MAVRTAAAATATAPGSEAGEAPPAQPFPAQALVDDAMRSGFGGLLDEFNEPRGPDGVALKFDIAGPPHDPREPDTFSAAWVGREAAIVLRRAIDGELSRATVFARGKGCLMFHEDRMVRRLMVGAHGERRG